ncbi:MAG TPA: phage tail sheath family protein [Arcobacter sp.]|nr:phage tail sheath family protein [Arcobacter sp.]
MTDYILPGVYLVNGMEEKRSNLKSFSTLFLSFELTYKDLKSKYIYLESMSDIQAYDCLKKSILLLDAVHVYFKNGGKSLYILSQTTNINILTDKQKYINFLEKNIDVLVNVETIVLVDLFLTEALLLTDTQSTSIQNTISLYCKNTNRLSLMDLPLVGLVTSYAKELEHCMTFYPWLKSEENNILPASIYASALFSKLAFENKVFYSIANVRLKGIVDLERLVDRAYASELYVNNINPIIYLQNDGYKIWGVKMLGSEIENINTVRVLYFIKRTITLSVKEYIFEPNDSILEEKIVRKVQKFLFNLWNIGALQGASQDEAFVVNVERIESQLLFHIAISIVKPLEYIVIHLNRTVDNDTQSTLNIS